MAKLRDTLEFIFKGGAVKRFHTVRNIVPQTDADHSFGVAWFIYLLTEGTATPNLIWAALSHDLAEHVTGDMPSMIKRNAAFGPPLAGVEFTVRQNAGLEFPLSEEEKKLLDLADYLEGMMYSTAERSLGNLDAERWYYRFVQYIKESCVLQKNERAREVFVAVQTIWEEVTCLNRTSGK